MFFDINGAELMVILVVAVLVIGPERLPRYAEQLAHLVRRARGFVQDTKSRVGDELGDEIKDVDWAALDPRRYDPRRIVRDALMEDVIGPVTSATGSSRPAVPAAARARTAGAAAAVATATGPTRVTAAAGPPAVAPFDDEAT